jgi:hypothetical protein
MTFGFNKMLRNFLIAVHLAASQGGFISGVQLFGILFISFIQFQRISKKIPLGAGGGGQMSL